MAQLRRVGGALLSCFAIPFYSVLNTLNTSMPAARRAGQYDASTVTENTSGTTVSRGMRSKPVCVGKTACIIR